MSKKCTCCAEVLPDCCINDVEVSYKVNGQTVLNRKRKICSRCQQIVMQEITTTFLQARRSSTTATGKEYKDE